jgi:hypothetical protein
MSLVELEQEVRRLSPADLGAFTRWLDEYTAEKWERQIEHDVACGKLADLARRADADFEAGKCTKL